MDKIALLAERELLMQRIAKLRYELAKAQQTIKDQQGAIIAMDRVGEQDVQEWQERERQRPRPAN